MELLTQTQRVPFMMLKLMCSLTGQSTLHIQQSMHMQSRTLQIHLLLRDFKRFLNKKFKPWTIKLWDESHYKLRCATKLSEEYKFYKNYKWCSRIKNYDCIEKYNEVVHSVKFQFSFCFHERAIIFLSTFGKVTEM